MVRIVIDDGIPYLDGVFDDIAEVKLLPSEKFTNDSVKDADGLIIRTRVRCDENLLAGTSVKYIASATIGYDHIDTDYCDRHSIAWSNAAGCNADSVYQYVLSAVLNLINSNKRPPETLTMGIIGVGNVGSRVEKMARVLGMEVLLNDPPRAEKEPETEFASLDDILENSDIISLHVPLNNEGKYQTFKLADSTFFDRLKKPVWFLNTSRGPVVDEPAFLKAVGQGSVTHSVIDVWENEPDINLRALKSITLGTPHIAGYSVEGKANGSAICVRALSRFFDLGLDDWYPEELPEPFEDHFGIDSTGKSELDIITEAIGKTYDIMQDDVAFRKDPRAFENYRINYPMRREPSYYSIHSGNIHPQINLKLKRLGFQII